MRVLEALYGGSWGGGSVVILAVTRALVARGDKVWVISLDAESDQRFREAGAELVRPPLWFRPINPLDIFQFLHLVALCRREKFDLVVTHTSKGGILGRLAARVAGIPNIIHHAHGFSFNRLTGPGTRRFYITLERLAARAGDFTISVNEQQRRLAIEYGITAPEQIVTVHNGIDLRPFSQSDGKALRRQLGFEDEDVLVGTIGRLDVPKGFVHLIRAVPLLLKVMPRAHLLIAGEGPLEASLRAEAARVGAAHRIHFLGFRRDIPDLLEVFDVFVQSSLWEGLPISLIEALAAGRPIVATDISGNREVVEDEKTAVIVPPGDPGGLSSAIHRVLTTPGLAESLARSARESAAMRFSEERMVRGNLEVYDRVVERRQHELRRRADAVLQG